jgi:hypothetical protein
LFTPHKEIHNALQQGTVAGFGCAACEDDHGIGLRGTQMPKRLDAFVFSLLRHRAGVDKHNVSRSPKGYTFKASSLKLGDESCSLCLIQTASKYFEGYGHEK